MTQSTQTPAEVGNMYRYCHGGEYQLLIKIIGVLGALVGNVFYGKITGPMYKEYFSSECIETDQAVRMTSDQFYKNYHHVESRHDLISAVEELAMREAIAWIKAIPADQQWSAQYDFAPLSQD